MSRGNLAWLLVVPALLMAGLIFSYSAPPPEADYQHVRTLVDVLAEVDKNYYKNLSAEEKKQLVESMIHGGLRSLDDHSQYFNEDALTKFEDENTGQYGGVGIIMAVEPSEPYLTVSTAMPGTPAYEAGIAPGDVILKIDGKSTENLSFDDARKIILGAPGTPVVFTIRRGDKEPENITLLRAKIDSHAVAGYERNPKDPAQWNYMIDPAKKIALIRLEKFNEKATEELKAAIEKAKAEGMKALILDLRGNPGGLLTEACKISDLFLAGGGIVSTKNRDGKGRNESAVDNKSWMESPTELPMVVLIDRMSASASEIVAAALQDNGRAVIIGERSYGKGSVQKVFHLPPDEKRAVKLTAETWFTPGGRNIHKPSRDAKETEQWGVLPSEGHAMKLSIEDLRKMALLRRKLDVIPGKNGGPVVSKKTDELPADYKDPVLEKALEYLRK